MKPLIFRRLGSLGLLSIILLLFQNCQPFQNPSHELGQSSVNGADLNLSPEQRQGKAIYNQSCLSCHGPVEDSILRDRTATEVSLAIFHVPVMQGLSYLTKNEKALENLEAYLSSPIMCKGEPRQWQASRLTGMQIQYSLLDILGVKIDRLLLPIDGVRGSFQNNVELRFDTSTLQSYLDFIENSRSLLLPAFKSKFVNCQETATTCLKTGFKNFAEQAFRTSLSTTEVDALYAVFTQSKNLGAGYDDALSDVLTHTLASARFLYPFEVVRESGVLPSGREIANRLALAIWFSIPDSSLLARATDGSLLTPAGLKSEVERMLKDAKGERFHKNFMGGWVGLRAFLEKSTSANSLDQNFQKETLLLLADAINSGGSTADVINANYTFVNQSLATHYGLNGSYSSDFAKVSLAPTKRRGLFSHGSFLSTVANATFATVYKRGNHVLKYAFCNKPSPPPKEVVPIEPGDQDPNLTEAELARQHRNKDSSCYACHARMDPVGLSLSMFDQFGKEKSSFTPIDRDLTTMPDGSELGSATALAEYLVKGHRLQSCFVSGLNDYVYSGYQPNDAKCATETYREKAHTQPLALKDWIISVITDSVINPR